MRFIAMIPPAIGQLKGLTSAPTVWLTRMVAKARRGVERALPYPNPRLHDFWDV
jgi:hypothetical protein